MGKRKQTYIIAAAIFLSICLCLSFIVYSVFIDVEYEPLDKCFTSSVAKKTLCNSSPTYTSYSEISPYMIEAVVLSEDDKFFMHKGVDWKELKNSFWLNLKHFSYKRGGSTITQQLVKNAYLSHEKSISRKIKELFIAYDIENKYTKKLILEKYLNAIEFGINLWGIKAAAKHYFDKSPSQLGILESLYLAILLPNPGKYSQSFRDKKLSFYQKNRLKILLNRLVKKRVIDTDYASVLKDEIDDFPWDEAINPLTEDLEEQIKSYEEKAQAVQDSDEILEDAEKMVKEFLEEQPEAQE